MYYISKNNNSQVIANTVIYKPLNWHTFWVLPSLFWFYDILYIHTPFPLRYTAYFWRLFCSHHWQTPLDPFSFIWAWHLAGTFPTGKPPHTNITKTHDNCAVLPPEQPISLELPSIPKINLPFRSLIEIRKLPDDLWDPKCGITKHHWTNACEEMELKKHLITRNSSLLNRGTYLRTKNLEQNRNGWNTGPHLTTDVQQQLERCTGHQPATNHCGSFW